MSTAVALDLSPVARELGLRPAQVESVIALLDDKNTVPFITRYRKDQTGGLDEEQIRHIESRVTKLRLLDQRKATILRSIDSQGKLTPELAAQIQACDSFKQLEDLYLPFKPQKQTLATAARERGLEPLADEILAAAPTCQNLDARAADFVNPDRQVPSPAEALLGAGHIIAERYSERADLRAKLRAILERTGKLVSTKIGDDKEAKAAKETAKTAPEPEAAASTEPTAAETSPPPAQAAPAEAAATVNGPSASGERSQIADGEGPRTEAGNGNQFEPAGGQQPVSTLAALETDPGTAAAPGAHAAPAADVPAPASAPPAAQGATAKPVATAKKSAKEARTAKKAAAKAAKDSRLTAVFRDFFQFAEALSKIPPHRVLAINRGERAKILRVKIEADEAALEQAAQETLVPADHPHADFLRGCARDALHRLILPSLEREFRREFTDRAEAKAVEVFAHNLRNLLLQPPIRGRRVLAIDPGFRSGCKVVALDEFGSPVENGVVNITGKAKEGEPDPREVAKGKLAEMITRNNCSVVAIGNGTGCRDTEALIADLIAQQFADKDVAYVIVNEAGASVYSTNPIGREEFPNLDATVRGSISIGRRLQDPLSELVKIEPPNIGVGMYQHDVKQKHLRSSLDAVVESCVNFVGVNLNTASVSLLKYVSGLNALTARRVYEHRVQSGPFTSREQLKEIAGLGDATFVQAAGFLRITDGANPLDATWIHPESYTIAGRVLEKLGFQLSELTDKEALARLAAKAAEVNVAELAGELGVGELTLKDILAQLARPGHDPREDLPPPLFKREILKFEDLKPGMELRGSVLNVVDFGAFVDIGLKDTGLVHISQMSNRYVKDPHDVVSVGDIVRVWVKDIEKERRRVSLTMVAPGSERTRPERRERTDQRQQGGPGGGGGDRGPRRRHDRPRRPPQHAPAGQSGPAAGAPEGAAVAATAQGQATQTAPPPKKPYTGGGRGGPPGAKRPFKQHKPPPPPPKLTKAKQEGRVPLQTFAELAVFLKKKAEGEPKPVAAPPPPAAEREEPSTAEPEAAEAPQQPAETVSEP
jgi:uncharacterized protein